MSFSSDSLFYERGGGGGGGGTPQPAPQQSYQAPPASSVSISSFHSEMPLEAAMSVFNWLDPNYYERVAELVASSSATKGSVSHIPSQSVHTPSQSVHTPSQSVHTPPSLEHGGLYSPHSSPATSVHHFSHPSSSSGPTQSITTQSVASAPGPVILPPPPYAYPNSFLDFGLSSSAFSMVSSSPPPPSQSQSPSSLVFEPAQWEAPLKPSDRPQEEPAPPTQPIEQLVPQPVAADAPAPQPSSATIPLCAICQEIPAETVFLECGHFACCKECAKPLTKCPMCRAPIVRTLPIYPC